MGVSVASGHPVMSGAGIPVIFTTKWNTKFYLKTSLASVSNTDYEGEIKNKGDEVKIPNIPDITISDYAKGGKLTYETLQITMTTLTIDQAKSWSFSCDDIDKHQSNLNFVERFTDDASEQMKIKVENAVYADIFSDAASANQGATAGSKTSSFNLGASGSPLSVNASNIGSLITDIGTVLDEQSVPRSDGNRWLLMPPKFLGYIKKSELKDASLLGDAISMARNGQVGILDEFRIFGTNNLTSTTDGGDTVWNIIAGHSSALTFAAQITNNERVRIPDSFGDFYRGLFVYGYKVVKPESLVWIYAKAA